MGCGGEEEEELISLTPVTRAGPGLVRLLSGTETHMARAKDRAPGCSLQCLHSLEISSVISEMATWSQALREDGIWAMGDARWSDENCSVSVENNKTGN